MEKAMGTYELRMRELDKRIEALQDKQTNIEERLRVLRETLRTG